MRILAAAHGHDAVMAVTAFAGHGLGFVQYLLEHLQALGPVDLELLPALVVPAAAADPFVIEDDRRPGVLGIKTAGAVPHALACPSLRTATPACARWRFASLVLCSV